MSEGIPRIDLRPDHWAVVRDILRRHVPDRKVLAFGSRATWTAKEYSDLDLALIGDEPLSLKTTSALAEDFSESELPFKVELVDWTRIDESFQNIIRRDQVMIQEPERDSDHPSMASDYPTINLGKLANNYDSQRIPLSRREREKRQGNYPYHGATGVMDHIDGFLFEGLHLLVAEDGSVEKTDGTPFLQLVDGKFWVNNHAHVLKAENDEDTRYLYYALSTQKIRPFISGSVQSKLSQANLNRIPIPYPTKSVERAAITHILGTLDDKIKSNRQMNETLETMAQAVFKDWFIDFGPTHAKAEGRPSYLPTRIWEMFPSGFNNEGNPVGWKMCRLENYLELAYGKSLPANQREPGIFSVYGSGGIVGKHNAAVIEGPAIIVGRKGTVGSLYWEDGPVFPIDTVFYVIPHVDSMLFCYHLLASQPLNEMNTDAAVPGLNRGNVYRLEFPCPDAELIAAFDNSIGVLWKRRATNLKEQNILTSTRNLLLPELICGELRVKDVETYLDRIL